MMTNKNPYETNTPEWQLFENMESQNKLVLAYTQDIERTEKKRSEASEKSDLYKAALAKLA